MKHIGQKCTLLLPWVVMSSPLFASGQPIDTGDTAWILTSAAFVLLMTPGLALFYGGMVRTKNVLATLFQSIIAIGAVGITWAVLGYSLAFSEDLFGGLIGGFSYFMLEGVTSAPQEGSTVPHAAFMIFQAMFAVITPALITGAFAERVRMKAWIPFMVLWSLLIYSPVCHWVWGPGGWIGAAGGMDFAGGLVVHMTAGFSALVCAILIGTRRDFGNIKERPHDPGMVLLGTGILFFGWFGFNAGSALSSNGLASHAFVTTFLSAASALLTWCAVDNFRHGKVSPMGAAIGCVVGLVTITPAAGFVGFGWAMVIGAIGATVANFVATTVREKMGIDDSLDVFACHGVGGLTGIVATGLFSSSLVNPDGADGLIYGSGALFGANLLGPIAVAIYSMIVTAVLVKLIDALVGFRVSDKEEEQGLDSAEFDEHINSQGPTVGGKKGKLKKVA